MNILPTPPITFSFGSISSATRPRFPSKNCTTWTWKNRRQNNHLISCKGVITNAARRGIPKVCAGSFEQQIFNQKSNKEECIDCVRKALQSIGDGRISVSAYDTACIALIKDVTNNDLPQFPSSLDWITGNQLSDGSWGDQNIFVACDRLLCTLACVVALRTWNVHPNESERGILFVNENISKLDGDDPKMSLEFEFLFPAFLERARNLGIQGLPYHHPTAQNISAARHRKLQRISKELKEEFPASLLVILEGLLMENTKWENCMKLQLGDGSFLGSPATTAFVFMETKDERCLSYLKKITEKFGGGAPSLYPVDILARLLAVDRLQQLGISRFFHSEIEDCLTYTYRFLRGNGVFGDVNVTSMAFRLLRLHGYNVGSGETILEEANHDILDNCLKSKHLYTEQKYDQETPWFASLPRLVARFNIEHYKTGEYWIGKTLYRFSDTNEEAYLKLAKLEYNTCQEQHEMEWKEMQKWYEDSNLEEFGISETEIVEAHFLAVASIYEVERSGERVGWVKSQIFSQILSTYYFIKESDQHEKGLKNVERIISVLFEALTQIKKTARDRSGGEITDDLLHEAWGGWLKKLGEGGTKQMQEAELIVRIINICGGHILSKELLSHHEYKTLSQLTNQICHQLQNHKMISKEIENEMQMLVQLVLQESPNGISRAIKQTFLVVAKTFYYRAYFSPLQIETHVDMVLFEKVM